MDSPWTPEGEGDSAGALDQAIARKVAEHRDACQRNGMDLLPLAVTHFSTLGGEASRFLGRVKRSITRVSSWTPREVLRPADLLLPTWNGARSLCVDVTVIL